MHSGDFFFSNKFVEWKKLPRSGEKYATFMRLLCGFHAALLPLVNKKTTYVGVWAVDYRLCNHFMWFTKCNFLKSEK